MCFLKSIKDIKNWNGQNNTEHSKKKKDIALLWSSGLKADLSEAPTLFSKNGLFIWVYQKYFYFYKSLLESLFHVNI